MGIVNPFANDGDWTESGGNVYRESGKVGIGTASPSQTLQVDAGSGFEAGQFNGSQNQYTASFRADTTTGQSYGPYIRGGSNSSDKAFVIDNGLGTSNFITVLGNGYCGINETIPLYSLDIDASNGMRISYGASSGGGGLVYNVSNSYLSIITSENIDSAQTCGLNVKSTGKRILLTNSGVGGNEVLSKDATDNSICLLSTDIRMGNTTTLNSSVVPDFLLSGGDAVFTGNVDAESITVDNITIDADDIILSTGPMTLQAAGGITLASIDQSVVIETNSKVLFKKNGVEEFDFSAGTIQYSNNQNSNLNLEATAHNVVGKDLTLSGGSTTAGTTDNIAGGDVIISGGQGKGTGNGGAIYLKTAPAGASGSTLNSLASAMTIKEGRVGIGTEVPNSGAILELATTSQALILPRLTAAQRPAGENGMLIYNTDDHKLNVFANGSWEEITSA